MASNIKAFYPILNASYLYLITTPIIVPKDKKIAPAGRIFYSSTFRALTVFPEHFVILF